MGEKENPIPKLFNALQGAKAEGESLVDYIIYRIAGLIVLFLAGLLFVLLVYQLAIKKMTKQQAST